MAQTNNERSSVRTDGSGAPVKTTYDPATDELLKPKEVAAMFSVDAKTVQRWARSGRLSFVRTVSEGNGLGHRRYIKREIEALLAASMTEKVD